MIHCFIDLEFNLSDKNIHKENKGMECVSIGACFLDNNFNEVDTFYSVIKPKHNIILGKRYEKLTKLKQEEVNNAKSFTEVLDEFSDVCKKYSNIKFYAWGPEDKKMLKKDIERNNYEGEIVSIINKTFDYQKFVSSRIQYKGLIIKNQWSLKDMQILYNNKEYNTHHNALTDAIMLKDIYVAFNKNKPFNQEYLDKFIQKKVLEEKQRDIAFHNAKQSYFLPNRIETYLYTKEWTLVNKEFLKKYKMIDKKYYKSKKIITVFNKDKIDIFYVLTKDDISHLALTLNMYNFSSIKRYLNVLSKTQKKDQ